MKIVTRSPLGIEREYTRTDIRKMKKRKLVEVADDLGIAVWSGGYLRDCTRQDLIKWIFESPRWR